MSVTGIFLFGMFVFGLCLAFVVISALELGREAEARSPRPVE